MRYTLLILLSVVLGSYALADYPPDIASHQLSDKSSIDEVLDALDARGHGFKTFSADVKHTEESTDFGDRTTHWGKVSYQDLGNGSARIRVTFDSLQKNDGKKINEKDEYELVDGKLIERHYRDKKQSTQQILRPGQKIDLFKLGEGPFPLPIGQPKEEVYKQFDVKKIDPAKDDPPGTVHLQLVPKPDTKLARKLKIIDTWVDAKSHMPVRIATRDKNETMDRTTELSNVQVNPSLSDADFDLGKLPDQDWNVTEQAFQE
jgi:outer membrane lipoprotein-sorting protein